GNQLTVTGNWTRTGGGASSTGVVVFNGAAAQSFNPTGTTLQNVTVNNTGPSTVTANVGFTVAGNLLISSGTLVMGAGNLAVTGTATVGTGTLDVSGGGTLTVTNTTAVNAGGTIGGGAGTMGFASAVTVSGTGAINGAAGAIMFSSDISGTGTLREASTSTTVLGSMTMGVFAANGGTVIINGAGPQTINGYTFNNVQVNSGNTVTSGGAWVVGGTLTLTAGTWAPGAFTHQVAGNWNDTSITFAPAAGIIQLTSANPTITQGATNVFFDLYLLNGGLLVSNIIVLHNLFILGGTLDANAAGPYNITLGNQWNQLGGPYGSFTPQTGTVTLHNPLAGHTFTVAGNNQFYKFLCGNGVNDSGAIILFEAATTISIVANGNFGIAGDPTINPATWIKLQSTVFGTQWIINLAASATLFPPTQYIVVTDSKAFPRFIINPNNVVADPAHNDTNWFSADLVLTSQTVDSNHNGKIDAILVGVAGGINEDFSGFIASVTGYTVIGYSLNGPPGSFLPTFFINLKESSNLDTGATPTWSITQNTTLFDKATGGKLVLIAAPPFPVADAAAPILGYTLAVAGGQAQIYMRFSEPVFHTGGGAPQLGDIVLNNTASGVTISGAPIVVSPSEYLLPLSAALTPDDIAKPALLTASVASNGAGHGLQDAVGLQLAEAVGSGHRVSDIGLGLPSNGIMEPMFAHDQTQSGPFPGGIGLIQLGGFDGSKWLRNRQDITLEGRIQTFTTVLPPVLGGTKLWYDIDVPAADRNGGATPGVWLPSFTDDVTVAPPAYGFSGLVPMAATGDAQARNRTELGSSTAQLRDFLIPGTDAKEHDSAVLDFLFQMTFPGGMSLYTARVANPAAANWYQQITPWTFDLRDIRSQRGGVQILNNVINPDKGQVTTLQFSQGTAGNVTVTVFDLSGSIIRVLLRQNQAAADYGVTWDGTNRSGAKVTRGLYFIRVIGPGFDETRKVLVVR
ncbi:MAG: FlgD immunoglobulin-like domain containing protein, partial [Spirochaetia bacterium]